MVECTDMGELLVAYSAKLHHKLLWHSFFMYGGPMLNWYYGKGLYSFPF